MTPPGLPAITSLGSVLLLVCSCGGGGRAVVSSRATSVRGPGPLTAYLPDAEGALWLSLRPVRWQEEPEVRRVLMAMVDEARLVAWGRRHGFDPFALERVAAARTSGGWLVLLRGPLDAPWQVWELGARMTGVRVRARRPWPRRWGWFGGRLLDVMALGPDTLMLATDVASAHSLREALRQGRHRGGPRVVPGRWGEPSAAWHRASAALSWHGAPALPEDSAAALLLSRTRRVDLRLGRGRLRGRVRVTLRIEGSFPRTAQENFTRLVEAIARSGLGELLGVREALPTLQVEATGRRVLLFLELDVERLAQGLRALLRAEMPELFAWPPADWPPSGASGGEP